MNRYMISLVVMIVTMLGMNNALGMFEVDVRLAAPETGSVENNLNEKENSKKCAKCNVNRKKHRALKRRTKRDAKEIYKLQSSSKNLNKENSDLNIENSKLRNGNFEWREKYEKARKGQKSSVVRAVTIAVVATWRMCHYANLLCQNYGTPSWLSAKNLNIGCMVAAGAVAVADYAFPGKVGTALSVLGLADLLGIGNRFFSKAAA